MILCNLQYKQAVFVFQKKVFLQDLIILKSYLLQIHALMSNLDLLMKKFKGY